MSQLHWIILIIILSTVYIHIHNIYLNSNDNMLLNTIPDIDLLLITKKDRHWFKITSDTLYYKYTDTQTKK